MDVYTSLVLFAQRDAPEVLGQFCHELVIVMIMIMALVVVVVVVVVAVAVAVVVLLLIMIIVMIMIITVMIMILVVIIRMRLTINKVLQSERAHAGYFTVFEWQASLASLWGEM